LPVFVARVMASTTRGSSASSMAISILAFGVKSMRYSAPR
jgi:hypothetical protein